MMKAFLCVHKVRIHNIKPFSDLFSPVWKSKNYEEKVCMDICTGIKTMHFLYYYDVVHHGLASSLTVFIHDPLWMHHLTEGIFRLGIESAGPLYI